MKSHEARYYSHKMMKAQEARYYSHKMMKAHNIKSFDSEYSKERYQKYVKKCKIKNLYFNRYEFLKIMEVNNTNINLSIERHKDYLNKYPHDYSAYAYYVSSLVKNKRLEEAKIELEELEKMVEIDYDNLCSNERDEKINSAIAYAKLKLLIYGGKYKEAYNYVLNNLFIIENDMFYLEAVILFNKKKLGYANSKYIKRNDEYLVSQLIDYSEDKLFDHIKKHLTDDTADEKNIDVFNSNFPIEDVIGRVRKNCPNDHAIYSGLFEDTYIYKYDNCGKIGKKTTDYFKVLAFHDSNEIINIVPCEEGKYLDYIDFNYLNDKDNDTKAISGLDRFNKKYAKYLIKR